jgi:hypothetical protein
LAQEFAGGNARTARTTGNEPGAVSCHEAAPGEFKGENEMGKINPPAGRMPSLSYAEKAVEESQPSEVETLPMQVTHAQMVEQSLSRCPGVGQGRNLAREFPAGRELPTREGGISLSDLVERSKSLPGSGGTTTEARASERIESKLSNQ